MERLTPKKGAGGILAFCSPKSADQLEKERNERIKGMDERRAQQEKKRSELEALRQAWGLHPPQNIIQRQETFDEGSK